jgi:hypothetical protein
MVRGARWAALLALLCGASACRTAGRLWRITPFEGQSEEERVNLWPLAYHAGGATAVLWPLFDMDARGFALRPLIAREESAYSVLWPLASFDTEADEGWIGPCYRFGTNEGLFPLANLGHLSWIGPWWWGEESRGLFPVLRLGGGTSYVGPCWWSGEGDEWKGGLFPLATLAETSYVGPAWWRRDRSGYGFLPLFGFDLFRSGLDHVGPVWWRPGASDPEWGVAPLFAWGDEGRRFAVQPLYSQRLGPDERRREILLGLGRSVRTAARSERWLLPLYYDRAEPERGDTVLLPLFWKRTRGERADVYTLLGNRSVDPESCTLNLYPLWWSNEDRRTGSAWRMLVPFFYFSEQGDERTLITPLGGRGWSESGERAFVNVLGPLYHQSSSLRRDEETRAFLWPLFQRNRRGRESSTHVLGLYSRTSAPQRVETSYAFRLGHDERTATGRSQRLWPLYSWSDEAEVPDVLYDWTLVGAHKRPERARLRVFPFFAREATPEGAAWDALLGLVHHERQGTETERVERTWAWPLYSRTEGARAGAADLTSLYGRADWEGGSQRQLGFSLLYSSREEADAAAEERSSRALLLFTHQAEERHAPLVPVGRATARENRVRHEAHGFLFDAFLSERSTYRTWPAGLFTPEEAASLGRFARARPGEAATDEERVRTLLAARGATVAGLEPADLRASLEAFGATHTHAIEERRVRIPLLYGYERSADELAWHGPLGLVSFSRDAEAERFSLLYYGYRSETRGGRTSRDLFPFVTWDSGPDETSWSFLWRLLHYEQKGARRGGHVLFLPWGQRGS